MFESGNQLWRNRTTHGKPRIYKMADELWQACCEYFEWVEANPLKEQKAFHHQGEITKTEINKMRAMTLGGLYLHIDITENTWANYRENEELKDVCAKVDLIIKTQKFEGAAADLLNPNIIARDLGLKDQSESRVETKLVKATGDLSDDELEIIAAGGSSGAPKTPKG